MELKIGVGVLLGIGLIGYIAIGAEQKDARPSKEERGSPKVESSRDLPVQGSVTVTEGAAVTEEEAPEIYQAFRARIAGGEQPPPPQFPALRLVETTGGTLATLEQGDGTMRVIAVAMNRENPDFGSADQGIACSAIITANGLEVLSEDKDLLARFVGKGTEQNDTDGADGGVAAAASDQMACTFIGVQYCCAIWKESPATFCQCCFGTGGGPPTCMCVVL